MASFSSCGFGLHWCIAFLRFGLVWSFRRFVDLGSIRKDFTIAALNADAGGHGRQFQEQFLVGFHFMFCLKKENVFEWTLTQSSQFDTISCSLLKHWCLWFRKTSPRPMISISLKTLKTALSRTVSMTFHSLINIQILSSYSHVDKSLCARISATEYLP